MSYQFRNAQRAKFLANDAPRWQIDRAKERGPCLRNQWNAVHPFTTREALQAFCEVNNHELDFASTYGEPGYSDPEKSILFANWNDIPKSLQTRLEAQGFELEWSDEWYVDHNNGGGKAYRTSPNGHGLESQLLMVDGGYLTPDDALEDWITQCEDNERAALPAWWDEADIAALGWTKQTEEYESGLREGSSDNPAEIALRLQAQRKTFLFQLGRSGDAYMLAFHVWVKEEVTS